MYVHVSDVFMNIYVSYVVGCEKIAAFYSGHCRFSKQIMEPTHATTKKCSGYPQCLLTVHKYIP